MLSIWTFITITKRRYTVDVHTMHAWASA